MYPGESANPIQPDKKVRPRKETWGAGLAIIGTLGAFFISQALAVYIVGLAGSILGYRDVSTMLDTSVAAQFVFYLIAESLVILFIYLVIKRYKEPLKQIGFARAPIGKDVAMVIGGYVVYFITFIFISGIAQNIAPTIDTNQKQEIGFTGAHGFNLVLVFCSLVILPPVTEEILFRGFLFRGLRKSMPVGLAVLFTSLLFGAAHLQVGSSQPLLWIAALDTFSLSLVLIWLRVKTGNLWASIGLHMLKNGLAYFVLFIVPLLRNGAIR